MRNSAVRTLAAMLVLAGAGMSATQARPPRPAPPTRPTPPARPAVPTDPTTGGTFECVNTGDGGIQVCDDGSSG